jgi:hypothetical protein
LAHAINFCSSAARASRRATFTSGAVTSTINKRELEFFDRSISQF